MGLKDLFEEAIGLGRSEDVRKIAVGVARARVDREVRSTPGARVRIVRDRRDGEAALALLWCVRNGVPVEIQDGPPGVWVDGERLHPVSPSALKARVGTK